MTRSLDTAPAAPLPNSSRLANARTHQALVVQQDHLLDPKAMMGRETQLFALGLAMAAGTGALVALL